MEACQQTDPFKFLIYAELAGAEISPARRTLAPATRAIFGRRPIAHPYIISAIRAATRLTASGSIGR